MTKFKTINLCIILVCTFGFLLYFIKLINKLFYIYHGCNQLFWYLSVLTSTNPTLRKAIHYPLSWIPQMFPHSYIAQYLFSSICLLNFVYFWYSIYKLDTRGLISCKEFQALEVSVIHTYIMAYCFSTDTRLLNL